MLLFDEALHSEALSSVEKTQAGVQLLYGMVPPDRMQAVQGLLWFYSAGKPEQSKSSLRSGKTENERAYDLTADASCIYAAFRQAYGIDLVTIDFLHWWEFIALLENLPDSTHMCQLMSLRTMDTSKIKDKEQRKLYNEQKQRFALTAHTHKRSVEQITQENKERVAARFAQAKKVVETKG